MNKEKTSWWILTVLMVLVLVHEINAQKTVTNPNGYNKFYFENGIVSSEGTLKEGKPEGYWKNYFPTGDLKSEGNRLNFLLDGKWKFYTEEGVLKEEIEYAEGKRNGITKLYSKEGFLVSSFPFVDDQKDGVGFIYYTNGGVKSEIPFEDGQENGKAFEFNLQGDIVAIKFYKNGILSKQQNINRTDTDGMRQGEWKEFDEDRNIIAEGKYRYGEKDGYWKEYSKKGELLETSKFEEGAVITDAEELSNLDIKVKYYTEGEAEGNLKFRGTFREGLKHGTHLWFSENGDVDSAKVYRNDKLVSKGNMDRGGLRKDDWIFYYYPDGELKAKGRYETGYKVGPWVYYYKNGEIEQKGKYDPKGRPDGLWNWFYENGQLLKEETYRNGQENGWSIEYSDSGYVMTKGEYIDGKEEGEWIYEIGDHKEVGSYEYGAMMGEWIHTYLSTGKTKFIGEFFDDLPNEKHVWYYENGQKMLEGKYISGVKDGEWRRYNQYGTILISIEYNSGQEVKVDGVKMKESSSE